MEAVNQNRASTDQARTAVQQRLHTADVQVAALEKTIAVLNQAVKAIDPVRTIGRIDSLWGRIRGLPRRAEEARSLLEIALKKLDAPERQAITRGSLHNRPLPDAVELMVGSVSDWIAERQKALEASRDDGKRSIRECNAQIKSLTVKSAEADKALRDFRQRIAQLADQQKQLAPRAERVASLVSSLPLRQIVATEGLTLASVLQDQGESRLLFHDSKGVRVQNLPKGRSDVEGTPSEYRCDFGQPVAVAPCPGDGAHIVVGEANGRVRLWDLTRQTLIAETAASGHPVVVAADERAIYVGLHNEIRVCDPANLAARHSFFLVGTVTCLHVDGQARKLYAGEKHVRPGYSAVCVWDLTAEGAAQMAPRRLRGFEGPVTALAVSGEASVLAAVDEGTGERGRLFFWDLNDLRIRDVEPCPASPMGGIAILGGTGRVPADCCYRTDLAGRRHPERVLGVETR